MLHPQRPAALVSATLHWLFADAAGVAVDPPPWPADASSSSREAAEVRLNALRQALDHHRGWTLLAERGDRIPSIPSTIVAEASARRRTAIARQLVIESDLAMVAETFEATSIPWACLKGPVLDQMYRRRGDTRAYSDLDVLVAPSDFRGALDALATRGAELRDRNWALMRARTPGEVVVVTRRGTVIDLHWSLVNQEARRSRLNLPSAELVARAVPVDVGLPGRAVPGLDPHHALSHLCLHAAASGAMKLVWLLDVSLACEDLDLDWEQLVWTARAWGTSRSTGLVLGRASSVLGAQVPSEVVRELRGRSGWAVSEAGARRIPARWTSGPPRLAVELARGSLERPTVTSMLADRARRRLADRTRDEPFVPSSQHPGSALYASGTPDDLAHYLDAVSRHEDTPTVPRWLRRYEFGDRGIESLVHRLRGVYDGLWLGILDDFELTQLDRAHYASDATYSSPAHNQMGLFEWEQRLVDSYLPDGGRIAVTGAGGGREVVALLDQGFQVVGYEPNPRLVASGSDLLRRLGHPNCLRLCAPRGWPGGAERFDAVLIGWGAYMHEPNRRRRIELLRDASAATAAQGAVLLSYWEMTAPTTQFAAAMAVAKPLRRLRRAAPPVFGDALTPNFAHHFTRKQIGEELSAAGLELVAQGSGGYGWAVGRSPRQTVESRHPATDPTGTGRSQR